MKMLRSEVVGALYAHCVGLLCMMFSPVAGTWYASVGWAAAAAACTASGIGTLWSPLRWARADLRLAHEFDRQERQINRTLWKVLREHGLDDAAEDRLRKERVNLAEMN